MKGLRVAVWILGVVVSAHMAYGQDWQPVTASELASGPAVDKSADAEALFWDVHSIQYA